MKNISLILNAVLLVAVVILYVKVFDGQKKETGTFVINPNDSNAVAHLPIAYINVDSLLLKYNFAIEANETLMKKQENSRVDLNMKAKQLQSEMNEFQRKLENNGFLSRERAEKEQNRLLKKQEDLQQMNQTLTQELMNEQQKVSEQLRDTINKFLKSYNLNKGYQVILSNTANDNVMLAGEGYDITMDVVEKLNERYKK